MAEPNGEVLSAVAPAPDEETGNEETPMVEGEGKMDSGEESEHMLPRKVTSWVRKNKMYLGLGCLVLLLLFSINVYTINSSWEKQKMAYMRSDPFYEQRRLTYDRRTFRLNRRKFRMLSGAVHYFRTMPAQWPAVLKKAKATGFNTIETVVPWNLHEPEPGKFNFGGMFNISTFISACKKEGLMVTLRVGPFVGADLDFGGLPGWLLYDDTELKVREYNAAFLNRVETFYDVLAAELLPYAHGRPIIAMELEHDLGNYGFSTEYITFLKNAWEKRGFGDMMFYTSDYEGGILNTEPVEGVLKTVAFHKEPLRHFKLLREVQKEGPILASELKIGNRDRWGDVRHFTRDPMDMQMLVNDVLNLRANLIVYLFYGGCNFGFMNGGDVDDEGKLHSVVSSMDYDAILDETTNLRRMKYEALAGTIAARQLTWVPYVLEENPIITSDYDHVIEMDYHAPLLDLLPQVSPYQPIKTDHPLHMERVNGACMGFVLYRHLLQPGESTTGRLKIDAIRDRAYVILDGNTIGILSRNDGVHELDIAQQWSVLDILVENLGRPSEGGRRINEQKGILGDVRIGTEVILGWEHHRISLENDHEFWPDVRKRTIIKDVSNHFVASHKAEGNWRTPMFFRGTFDINPDTPYISPTFLKIEGHGMAWINGFPLGRFWSYRGPLQTLYVPSVLLKEGKNRVIILQLEPHVYSGKVWLSLDSIPGESILYDSRIEKLERLWNEKNAKAPSEEYDYEVDESEEGQSAEMNDVEELADSATEETGKQEWQMADVNSLFPDQVSNG